MRGLFFPVNYGKDFFLELAMAGALTPVSEPEPPSSQAQRYNGSASFKPYRISQGHHHHKLKDTMVQLLSNPIESARATIVTSSKIEWFSFFQTL